MANRPGALSLGWRSIRRQLASEPAVVASIAIAVLMAALLIASGPRLLQQVSDDDLNAAVSEPPPAQRNIRVEREARIGPGSADDPMGAIRRSGDGFAETAIPPSVSAVISDHYFVVDSPEFAVSPLPGEEPPHPFDTFIRFRYQEHIEERLTLVEGTMPVPQEPVEMLVGDECPQDPADRVRLIAAIQDSGPAEDVDCALEDVPHFQAAVSQQTAIDMGYGLGDMVVLSPDPADSLFFGLSMQDLDYRLVMSISGIAEFSDPGEEYWYGDTSLHRPAIQENADLRIIFATGLMSPDDYGAMLTATGMADRLYTWRYFVDPGLIEQSDVDVLVSELIPFQLRYTGVVALPTEPRVITQLPDLLNGHLEQREQTVSVLSISIAGLLSVAVALIVLLGVLMTERQRSSVVLTRSRGASTGQLTMSRLYEALLLIAPAAVLGYLVAESLFPDTTGLVPYRATVALTAGATMGLVGAGLPLFRRRLGSLQTRETGLPQASGRRVVIEVLAAVLAVGSVILLRRRGQIDDPEATSLGFDLLLALAPTLIGIAVGLAALRLYPLVIRSLSWVGAKTRGLVPFVGFRRVLQQSRLPVLVILLCVAAATYSWVMRSSVAAGQEVSSWQAVGADYSVEGFGTGTPLPASVDFDTLGPVDQIAFGRFFARSQVEFERNRVPGEALAIDAPAYQSMAAGTDGDPRLPGFMLTEPPPEIGTEASPIPAIVSRAWPSGLELSVGDVFRLDLGSLDPQVEVRQLRDRYPGIDPDRSFVVFSLSDIEAFSDNAISRSVAYIRAGRDAEDTFRANLADQSTSAVLDSRYEFLDAVADDPFIEWAGQTLTIVFVFATVFAGVAAIAAPAIATAARRRDLGYLRTMGLDERQSTLMTIIEQLPPVLVGTITGVVTGMVAAWLLAPAITLDVFTGNLVPTELLVDWPVLIAMTVALLGVLGVATVIFVVVNRRTQLNAVLRIGDE